MTPPHDSVWIFPWRRSFQRRWHLLVSLLIVLPLAGLVLATVRVRVFAEAPILTKRAELVLLLDDPANRDWLVKISQRTPFPHHSSSITESAAADIVIRDAMRPQLIQPAPLRDVEAPNDAPPFSSVAVLPTLQNNDAPNDAPIAAAASTPQPRVRLLQRSAGEWKPETWPPFAGTPDSAEARSYLIHIAANGTIDQCLPLDGDAAQHGNNLANWLRTLRYPSGKNLPTGWQVCEIYWSNPAP